MKRIMQLIIGTVLVLMFLNVGMDIQAAQGKDMEVHVEYGYDNFFKFGEYLPVIIHAENKLEDFEGEVRLQYHINEESDGVLTQAITLEKGSRKDIKFLIPSVNENLSIIKISFIKKKEVIYEEKLIIPFLQGISYEKLLMGFLTDDYDAINYIEPKSDFQKVKLNAENFPDNIFASKMLNVILINNFDMSRLSDKQMTTLEQWVIDGGYLIIGTGVNYSKTLSGLKDFVGITSIAGMEEIETSSLNAYVHPESVENTKGDIPLTILKFESNQLMEAISNGEDVVAYKMNKGKGIIDLFAFDLGMEPMKSYSHNKKFIQVFFEQRMKVKNMRIYAGSSNRYLGDSIDRFLKVIPQIKLPSLLAICVIIALYILLVGPILYIVLKRKGKRHYMWIGVPILSLVFVIVMYMFGMNTRIKHPVTQVVNIVNFNEEGASRSSFGTVLNTNKSSLEIKSGNGLYMIPLVHDNWYYDRPDNSNFKNYKDYPVTFNWRLGLEPSIKFYKTNVFSNNNFELEVSKNVPMTNQVEIDATSNGHKLDGTIMNNYDFDLNDCIVIYKKNYYFIDRLDANEKKNIKEFKTDKYGSLGDYYWKRMDKLRNGSNLELRSELYQKNSIIRFNSDIYDTFNSEEVVFIGWTNKDFSNGFIINGKKAINYEKTTITVKDSVDYINGATIVLDYGEIKPYINGKLDQVGDNIFYSQHTEFNLSYPLPIDAIDIEKIKIKKVSKYKEKMEEVVYALMDRSNNPLKELDDVITIDKQDINKYINDTGELTISAKLSNSGDVEIPEIYIEGIGK